MVNVVIDGKRIAAEEGLTVLEAARRAGIHIPTLCHHESLAPYGACRFCIVEVTQRGKTRLMTSCTLPVSQGQEIQTATEKVMRIRRMLAELMLARCPASRTVRAIAADVGVKKSRFRALSDAVCQACGACERRRNGLSTIVGEAGCILCGMCVRLCDDVLKIGALAFEGRGANRQVTTPFREMTEVCMVCGACSSICPTHAIEHHRIRPREPQPIPSEFEEGLTSRKPIYVPFPQAVPNVPVIDPVHCTHFKTGGCNVCEDNCEVQAINHAMQDEIREIEVGNIILATGWDLFDCRRIPQYGYGRLPNVFTSLEFERMCNASGPTGGRIVLRDGVTEPKSVCIVHCVGSRDAHYNQYCSSICCMLSLKLGHLVMEKTQAKVYACYIDMRPNKKDYEEFYQRLLEEGMLFVRGKVAEVTDVARFPHEEGKLIVQVEDTLLGKQRRIPVDMVVLMGALEPRHDAREIGLKAGISCGAAGWFIERHPKLDPVATMTDGVFIAGACQGPKDIPDSVAQGAAAAARVQGLITKGTVMIEPVVATVDEQRCSGCRICNNLCPFNAIAFVADDAVSRINAVLCKGCGTCVAACPAGAIAGSHFANEQVEAEIEGLLWDAHGNGSWAEGEELAPAGVPNNEL